MISVYILLSFHLGKIALVIPALSFKVVYHLIILDSLREGRGVISQGTLDEHLQVFILLCFIVTTA